MDVFDNNKTIDYMHVDPDTLSDADVAIYNPRTQQGEPGTGGQYSIARLREIIRDQQTQFRNGASRESLSAPYQYSAAARHGPSSHGSFSYTPAPPTFAQALSSGGGAFSYTPARSMSFGGAAAQSHYSQPDYDPHHYTPPALLDGSDAFHGSVGVEADVDYLRPASAHEVMAAVRESTRFIQRVEEERKREEDRKRADAAQRFKDRHNGGN